jgi:hypothetical protein|tara:strand:- start:140 stop:310 length:171 start_codon:yes stop_codon:yes gene_type:complete
LKKEYKNYNPLDNVKVLPNATTPKPVVKKTTPTTPAKASKDASKTDPTDSNKPDKD